MNKAIKGGRATDSDLRVMRFSVEELKQIAFNAIVLSSGARSLLEDYETRPEEINPEFLRQARRRVDVLAEIVRKIEEEAGSVWKDVTV